MKCQRQILGIRWSDFISDVDVQARRGLTPLGEILAARRISVSGHIARLDSDVSAHMALRSDIDLSVGRPPGPNWRRRPGRPRARWIDQIRRDSSSSPVELWGVLPAVAICCWSDVTAPAGHAILMMMMIFLCLTVEFCLTVFSKMMMAKQNNRFAVIK